MTRLEAQLRGSLDSGIAELRAKIYRAERALMDVRGALSDPDPRLAIARAERLVEIALNALRARQP